jgi:hypothetical protein
MREIMRLLIAALFGAAIALPAVSASAQPQLKTEIENASSVETVAFSARCVRWYRYCKARHPESRARFRACYGLHGCFKYRD